MHLSLHLAVQLRDHGPATSWWSMPYERMMGVMANIPFRPGRSSVDTAKRALALLEVTAKATPLEGQSQFGRFGSQLPAGPGFEHGVRRTDNGGRYHWYRFVGKEGNHAARLLHLRRLMRSEYLVRGCEPYPGLLFNCGQLFRPRMCPPRSMRFSAQVAGNLADVQMRHVHSLSHVRRCLLAHHLTTRAREVHAAYDARIAAAGAGSGQQQKLRSEQAFFIDPAERRTEVFAALLSAAVDASWLMAPVAFETVLTWYQQCGGAAWDRVDVYNKLFFAGEEFGSDIVSRGQNALISASFAGPGDESKIWYGRVCYYVRHTFAGKPHDYAVVRWYDFAEDRYTKKLKLPPPPPPAPRRSRIKAPAPRPALRPLVTAQQVEQVEETFQQYPIVSLDLCDADIRDVIPVHRVTGRWIAMQSSIPKCQLVCPIRTRVHG